MEIFCFGCCPMGTSALRGTYSVIHSVETKWTVMSCEDCNVKFNLLKRKRTCNDCGHNYCVSCVTRIKGIEKQHRCNRCQVFAAVPLNRNAVTQLKVKDLLWYLDANSISTQGCKEKAELVDLVMHHSCLRNAASAYPQNYERHTEILESGACDNEENTESLGSSPSLSGETAAETSSGLPQTENAAGAERASTRNNAQDADGDDGFTLIDLSDTDEVEDSNSAEQKDDPIKNASGSMSTPKSIEDITSEEQISTLSVMTLKLILTRSFVGFKGCCEKQELQEKVRWLWKQKQEAKEISNIDDDNLCKICMEEPIDAVLLECGHMATCTKCGKRLTECPICRQYVVRVVHIFKA